MNQRKSKNQYAWRSIRVYSENDFTTFSEICKNECSNVHAELNRYVKQTVKAGTLGRLAANSM